MKRDQALVRTALLAVACLSAFAAFRSTGAATAETRDRPRMLINLDDHGVAIQGYDPVAYFTDNKPVKGSPETSARHEGAIYYFASARHKTMFEADPEHYVPQYGGFCGYAASIDKLYPVDPEWFQVIDGKLILQRNKKAWELWNRDVPGNLAKADANWPGLVERHGK